MLVAEISVSKDGADYVFRLTKKEKVYEFRNTNFEDGSTAVAKCLIDLEDV
jgi:hypothetical protein